MHLTIRLFSCFLVLFASFVSCFGTYQANPVAGNNVLGGSVRQDHSHFSTMVRNDYKPGVQNLLNYGSQIPTSLNQVRSPASKTILNVDHFGAKADGTDDTEAFGKAWNQACSSKRGVIIVVPKRKIYYLKPINFSGPCNSDIVFKIFGTIKASVNKEDYEHDRRHWIVFDSVSNLRVRGGGTIDGNGRIWWESSCKINKNNPCHGAPTAMTFVDCKSVIVANLMFKNAQQMHLTFQRCVNVRAVTLSVIAPGKSPNTDGIHVTGSQNVRISKSIIRTGDDCISIVSGSKNIQATGITCGPGHGISIGSLGADNSEAEVSDVLVDGATLSGTTNGVRIKTWQGGSGYAKNIVFRNVVMRNVTNPIIINQNYCDQNQPCKEQSSAVQVSNVMYKNIKGTSASEVATKFDCSKTVPCQGILLQDISLTLQENGDEARASCDNVELIRRGNVFPQCSS